MRLLVDTRVFLWLAAQPERLGAHLEVLSDPRTDLLFSAASSWEIAIKYGLGRLRLPAPPQRWVPHQVRQLRATAVPIDHAQALAVAELPPIHSDPFDRLLVSVSTALKVPLVTADAVLARYGIDVLPVEG